MTKKGKEREGVGVWGSYSPLAERKLRAAVFECHSNVMVRAINKMEKEATWPALCVFLWYRAHTQFKFSS